MIKGMQRIIETVGTVPGQGSILDQIDKILRKEQRMNLFEMLEQLDPKLVETFPVVLYRIYPQNGMKDPALLRFQLPKWQGYDEVFWQAMGDYIVLAVHRVTDVEYDRIRGTIKVHYFAKTQGRIKSPEHIRKIIQSIGYLMDTEALPTDFTRFRSMAERRGHIGDLSKEQAAIIGAALKLIKV